MDLSNGAHEFEGKIEKPIGLVAFIHLENEH
jgi:hypothetical protein